MAKKKTKNRPGRPIVSDEDRLVLIAIRIPQRLADELETLAKREKDHLGRQLSAGKLARECILEGVARRNKQWSKK